MDKLKSFITKIRVYLFIFLFFVASIFVYIFVFAEDDEYANYLKVDDVSAVVIDGTEPFDSDNEDGNDSSNSNGIIRTFDKIQYKIQYNLRYKEDSELEDGQDPLEEKPDVITRNIGIDILIPINVSTYVSEVDNPQGYIDPVTTEDGTVIVGEGDNRYIYYHIEQSEVSTGENHLDIILDKVYAKDSTTISPIIRVRELTDNILEKDINKNSNLSKIEQNKIDGLGVSVSAKDNYALKLYQGTKSETGSDGLTTMPIGIVGYIPSQGEKGIKGSQVPSQIDFNLKITSNMDNTVDDELAIIKYDSDTITGMPRENINPQPLASIDTQHMSLNNNKVSTVPITISDLTFNKDSYASITSDSDYYFTSKLFTFNSYRTNSNHSNIIYSINAENGNASVISNTLDDYEDNYLPFVGDYVSKVNFYNKSSQSTGSTDTQGSIDYINVLNYNEQFYIENTIDYAKTKGDDLYDGITHYIKFDSDVIKLSEADNNLLIEVNGRQIDIASENVTVSYGVGKWESSYFNKGDNLPSGCPASIDNLSKEDLMNQYGGPCIKDKTITWYDTISEIPDENKNDIILFKIKFDDNYEKNTTTKITISAKAKNNPTNVGKTFAVITRGQTRWNNSKYYLSEIPKTSATNMVYTKMQYDSNYNVTAADTSTVDSTLVTNNFGSTILVSPFKAFINEIKTNDIYDSDKTIFYSGLTDPIEFVINPVIYKSAFEATIINATVDVYLPDSLEIYVKKGDKAYESVRSETINSISYNVYTYKYSEDDIKFESESVSGTIPILKVHAYISLNTTAQEDISADVFARISGTLKPNTDATTTYTDVTPLEQRTTTTTITLRNTRNISSIGKTNLLRIEKNGTYQYNMRAANSSNSSSDISLMYILPYTGDGVADGSNFNGTISVSILNSLPEGYKAYYTDDKAQTLLTNEISSSESNNWKEYTNTTTPLSNITAIKIVPSTNIPKNDYFAGKDGITLNIKTNGNKELEKYFNRFYIIQKDADICNDEEECTNIAKGTVSYASNISEVSVYNRIISGYVFEDSNYNGFHDNKEKRLSDVTVDLYKLNKTDFTEEEAKNPKSLISEDDELVNDEEMATNYRGYYKFSGLESGNYYVKYTFNCEKYTVTEKNKIDIETQGDASLVDSDAQMIEIEDDTSTKCYAISNILTLNNNKVENKHIDMGLRVREEFDIKVKKYITNVKVISNGNVVQDNNYDNKTKVKVDVKNLKNTSLKVTYGIEIENTKYFPGTIGNIVETIPDGMTFDPNLNENDGWYEYDGRLYYAYLSKTLIMPSEKYHLKIVLDLTTDSGGDYINLVSARSLKIKPVITNFLEIPEDDIIIEDENDEHYEEDDGYYPDSSEDYDWNVNNNRGDE